MTDRIPLDHLTSDALDALHAELDQLREELAESQNLHQAQKRMTRHRRTELERAEAALARVHAAVTALNTDATTLLNTGHHAAAYALDCALRRIIAAINEPATPAGPAGPCPGYPTTCPNPRNGPALPPASFGGIRCGCGDQATKPH